MQSVNTGTVFGKHEIAAGREAGSNGAVIQESCFKNFEGNVGKISQNLNTQKTNNPERTATELHAQTAFNRSRLNMDKALDTLWEIEYCIQDKDARDQLGLKTESGFWGTLKNAFCKFLGFFCNAVKENRTNVLNQQIDDILKKICDNKDFYENVLLPVMNDRDIDEELKTACFNLFKDKEKLFSDLKNPNADIFRSLYEDKSSKEMEKKFTEDLNKLNADDTHNILGYYKDEIKDGKLFGNDVCDRWLSPLMNEGNATDEIKLKLYLLFDDNPEIQDKLFKSLKEPPKEIREQFWERNKEKILNGSILKELLGIKNLSATLTQDEFMECDGNPLKEMVFKGLKTIPEKEDFINKDADIIAESFNKKEILNFVQDKNDLKRYLDCYAGVLNKPGYMEKWLKMVTEVPKKGEELSKLQNKVSGIKDFFSGTKNFDEISNLGLGTKDVFADLDRNPPANGSITFDFGLKGSIELNTSKIRSKSKKDFFEDIKKQVTDLKLNENEISRLADFLCTVEPQGYMFPLKIEFNFEEHSFKPHVSFEENQTKITMPLKDEPVTLLLNAGIYSKNSAHINGMEGAESLKQKLTGKHMSGTMEVIAKGTSMINSETTTEFKNFRINVPDF